MKLEQKEKKGPEQSKEKALTLDQIREILPKVWSKETCAPRWRKDWTPENPAVGQCFLTAYLVQEYCGIEIPPGKIWQGHSQLENRKNEIYQEIRQRYQLLKENVKEIARENK